MREHIMTLVTSIALLAVCFVLIAVLYMADSPARTKAAAKAEEERQGVSTQKKEESDRDSGGEAVISAEDFEEDTSSDSYPSVQRLTEEEIQNLPNVKARKLTLILGKVGNAREGGYSLIRTEPDEESDAIDRMTFNNAVLKAEEESEDDDWIAVEARWNGQIGYVRRQDVKEVTITLCDTGDKLRDNIVAEAYKCMGIRFKSEGDSPGTGFDCSHFIHYVFGNIGMEIPDRPKKIFKAGKAIDEKDARPGDIVFYDVNDGFGHVALYIGEGLAINTTGHNGKDYPKGGVHITALTYKDREEYTIADIIDQ